MDDTKTGALFVDFENVFYGLVSEPESLTRDAALSATMEALTRLRKQLREERYALVVERCYADWEKMPESAQRQLQLSGVLPRFVDARAGKNTADIELSLDLLHTILTRKELRHVVLIGGDRDYLPILRRVKEEQRHVVVCALRASLSGDIREFVDNYVGATMIVLDSLIELGHYRRSVPSRVLSEAPSLPRGISAAGGGGTGSAGTTHVPVIAAGGNGPPPSGTAGAPSAVGVVTGNGAATGSAVTLTNGAPAGNGVAVAGNGVAVAGSGVAPNGAGVPGAAVARPIVSGPLPAGSLPAASGAAPPAPSPPVPAKVPPPRIAFNPSADYKLHERYLQAMGRFMREHRYREIHLGPFFRWITAQGIFSTESSVQLRKLFEELQGLGAVQVEERDTGQGYGFSVVSLNYNHPLVQRSNDA